MANIQPFNLTSGLMPGRSVHDLSYEKKFTCDMGQLIPVMCDEVVPGDYFDISNMSILRMQPLVAPVLHEINMYTHYFFVPYRILDNTFEDFITRGVTGDTVVAPPTWNPTLNTEGSLWDYLGFPIDVDCAGCYPLDYPRRAYNMVWNEYYRSQDLQSEVLLSNEQILNRGWERDYLVSALPFQQRGTSPAVPLTGVTSAEWASADFTQAAGGANIEVSAFAFDNNFYINNAFGKNNAELALDNNIVDLSTASSFDIADLRAVVQIQKWMERNARTGARYVEQLKAHFGVSPRDERLQRPEYIGGTKAPVIVSEVLQTSSTDAVTPQGNLAGHGISVVSQSAGTYHAKEYGLIIGMMSVMPVSAYQQRIDRQWLRKTTFDFYFPEFAHLAEQGIENAEVCVIDGETAHNQAVFGYAGRYDEMRVKHDMVCGKMRTTYNYWHLGRLFDDSSTLTAPALNDDFIVCSPRKDIFAVPTEPGLIISFGNIIKAHRPIPVTSEPGLMDHF